MTDGCDPRSIGIFDSGLGGMTVASAVRRAFPNEAICYLGDTARVPYGTKSPETVRNYAREDIAFLLGRGVKIIIAACNTVSAAALPDLHDHYETPLVGVVEMGAQAALADGRNERERRRVGVIGTETTIRSGAYERAIRARSPEAEVITKACPLFVPLIEEGWVDHPVMHAVIEEYLSPMRDREIDALILGCTHYPLIRPALGRFFGPDVRIVDSAQAMVLALKRAFDEGEIEPAPVSPRQGAERSHYYVTDRCNHFRDLVAAFMGASEIEVRQVSCESLVAAAAGDLGVEVDGR